jgi:hypothetical protein
MTGSGLKVEGGVSFRCPRCGLTILEGTRRCDCGLDLAAVARVSDKPVHLRVGSRELLVGTAPVSRVKPSDFPTQRLRRQGDDLLVLWPTVYRRIALIPLIIGAATVITHMLWSRDSPAKIAFNVCLGAFILGLGVVLWVLPRWFERICLQALSRALGGGLSKLLPRRFEFDRAAGHVRQSWPDPWRERPLSNVLAIQLIKRPRPYGNRRYGRKIGIAYELILVLDDADWPRVSLATYPAWPSHPCRAGADAAELAGFLGVALLDEVSGKETKEVAGDADGCRTGRCT